MNHSEQKSNAKFLDKAIPLHGASHAEVVKYLVDIPMRYAECCALLADGKTARLADSQQFLGWSGHESNPSLLFCNGRRRIVVQTGTNSDAVRRLLDGTRKFIARDGDQLTLGHWRTKLIKAIGRPAQPQETGIFLASWAVTRSDSKLAF